MEQSQLARRFGIHPSQLSRKASPSSRKPLTVPDLLLIRLIHPRLYLELVNALQELEVDSLGEWQPQDSHACDATAALGKVMVLARQARVAPKMTRKLRDELDQAWHELEMVARLGRRQNRRDR